MSLPPEIMKELISTFRIDVDDQLQAISDSLLGMEKEADVETRGELLRAAMRAAHNIKGAARGIGVGDVGEVSHGLENLLTILMKDPAAFRPGIGDLCFEAVDAIKLALQAYIDEGPLGFDKADLIARLSSGVGTAAVDEKPAPAAEPAPAPEPEPEPAPQPAPAPAPEPEPAPAPEPKAQPKAAPAAKAAPEAKGGEVVRISVDKLDRLEALVEEMHASKIDMDDFVEGLRRVQSHIGVKGQAGDDVSGELERIYKFMRSRARSMGVVLSSVRYEMRTLRLVPAAGLTRALGRSVRDIARQMGKMVTFETVGEDTEMDRAVMDLLTDPLVHLLRNAIDHGIEPPEDRARAGKPETGTIRASFRLEGGMVRIALTDDGAGIDIEGVRKAAVGKKVVGEAEAARMSARGVLDLIFHPGFSTKRIITDVSGRGVGMDIVRSNIQALRGDIAVETEVGVGTTFTLSVPLTMATERGVVVKADGQVYALPVGNVVRVVDVHGEDDLVDVEGSRAVLIDGQPVALRRLSRVLGGGAGEAPLPDHFPVVVVSAGWRRVGLIVDDVAGQREMVVRPLSKPLVHVANVAGGTLIGGRVRIVLDAESLVSSALKAGAGAGVAPGGAREAVAAKTILAVDDSLTTRTLVKNVLESSGYDVTSAVNGEEAWRMLGDRDFDLVVSDVEMPKMDGFELTRRVKGSDRHGATPVIIVTSLASEEDKQKGIEVGADAYIVKGDFETRVLLDVVEQLI